MQFDTHDPDHLLITHERLIEPIVDGGFEFPFIGDESETFLLKVTYPNEPGRLPDQVPIPAVVISISNPVTGRVISTLNALVPPPDMPYPLGQDQPAIAAPPGIKSTPDPLIGFDPTRSLSFTFTEGVTRESVESDHAVVLVDDSGAAIRGTVRLSNQNKTVTFVPDAPLRLNAGYTLTFNYIRDASDNMMARADFRITTVGPSVLSASAILNLLEQLTIVKKPGPGGTTQTLAFGMTGDLGQDPRGRDPRPHVAQSARRPEHDSGRRWRPCHGAARSRRPRNRPFCRRLPEAGRCHPVRWQRGQEALHGRPADRVDLHRRRRLRDPVLRHHQSTRRLVSGRVEAADRQPGQARRQPVRRRGAQ